MIFVGFFVRTGMAFPGVVIVQGSDGTNFERLALNVCSIKELTVKPQSFNGFFEHNPLSQ